VKTFVACKILYDADCVVPLWRRLNRVSESYVRREYTGLIYISKSNRTSAGNKLNRSPRLSGLVRSCFEGGLSALASDARPSHDSDRFCFVLAERAIKTDVDVSRLQIRVLAPGR